MVVGDDVPLLVPDEAGAQPYGYVRGVHRVAAALHMQQMLDWRDIKRGAAAHARTGPRLIGTATDADTLRYCLPY